MKNTDTQKVKVTMKGNPIALMGTPVGVGQAAPDFKVVDAAFKPVKLSDFKGQVVLISAVPSLDTGVCSLQTKRFNEEASHLPSNVVVLTISEDLPFAQKRFCGAEGLKNVIPLSTFRHPEFGDVYGVRMADSDLKGLMSRAIVVIDESGKVVYTEQVAEISNEPDYGKAIKAVG